MTFARYLGTNSRILRICLPAQFILQAERLRRRRQLRAHRRRLPVGEEGRVAVHARLGQHGDPAAARRVQAGAPALRHQRH